MLNNSKDPKNSEIPKILLFTLIQSKIQIIITLKVNRDYISSTVKLKVQIKVIMGKSKIYLIIFFTSLYNSYFS